MVSPELLRTPFSKKLIKSSITPYGKDYGGFITQRQMWRFQEFEGMPEKVIRFEEYATPYPDIEVNIQRQTKISLDKAKEYGIPIPDVEIVLGPSYTNDYFRAYTIVDKIHGYELGKLPSSIPFPIAELDSTLSHIIEHSIAMGKKGMPIFCDFENPEEMFMYGKRVKDEKDKLWVVDIDLGRDWQISNGFLASNFENICYAFHISNKEYPKSTQKLIEFFNSINKTDKAYVIIQDVLNRLINV